MSDDRQTIISELVAELISVQCRIQEAEEHLNALKEQEVEIQERRLPELMEIDGYESLPFKVHGKQVELSEQVFARISKENQDAAFRWLREHNEGGMIKEEVIRRVHPQTLKAWVRGKREEGAEIPEELFSVYTKKVVKLK